MVYKEDRKEYLMLLQTAIQSKHKCMAVHRESVHVHERLGDETIWEGSVEVFDLKGHADAERCYAWPSFEKNGTGSALSTENPKLITVLGKRPVDSPEMAVRAAIFFDVQLPVPGHPVSQNKQSLG